MFTETEDVRNVSLDVFQRVVLRSNVPLDLYTLIVKDYVGFTGCRVNLYDGSPHARGTSAVARTGRGKFVHAANVDGCVREWGAKNVTESARQSTILPTSHSRPDTTCVQPLPGGQRLAVVGNIQGDIDLIKIGAADSDEIDRIARNMGMRIGRRRDCFEGHKRKFITGLACSGDGSNTLASSSRDCTVAMWDIETKTLLNSLVSNDPFEAVEWVDSLALFACANRSNTVTLWDHRVGKRVRCRGVTTPRLQNTNQTYAIAVPKGPNSSSIPLIAVAAAHTVALIDVRATKTCMATFGASVCKSTISAVAFASTSRHCGTSSVDITLETLPHRNYQSVPTIVTGSWNGYINTHTFKESVLTRYDTYPDHNHHNTSISKMVGGVKQLISIDDYQMVAVGLSGDIEMLY
jgi:WD40 repeat protein